MTLTHISTPEALHGLLGQLADHAIAPERGLQLFALWPSILERLLPDARKAAEPLSHARFPADRDVQQLDEALLPSPPDNAMWPQQETSDALARWVSAFTGRPHVLDRLITVLGRHGLLLTPESTRLVLRVAGGEPRLIASRSKLCPAWVRLVMIQSPEAGIGLRQDLTNLIDELAVVGDAEALALQLELER